MQEIVLVKYGEIILKGLNRPVFENILIGNIKASIQGLGNVKVTKAQATIYVEPQDESVSIPKLMERLAKVFGILSITRACVTEKDIDAICKAAAEYCGAALRQKKVFKVESKRADKKFPLQSPQISHEVGGYLYNNIEGLTVDVNNPVVKVMVEVRDFGAYISCEKTLGQGGLPIGTGGRASLLLSGGIDSPVAGYMMAKRGVELDAINFFSYPYTSERAKQKVISLARILTDYTTKMHLHIVPFTEIQLAIREKCPEEHMTLIMRRLMMQISEIVALGNNSEALITGESLGQVASQTIQALHVTNSVVEMPVFRPLIGMDKEEIVQIARRIDTFETSILPYEDCCTVFTPKHPTTRPKLERILLSESKLDVEGLVQRAVEGKEVIRVLPE